MKVSLLLFSALSTQAMIPGPLGQGGATLYQSGQESFDLSYGRLNHIQSNQGNKLASPIAWGQDTSQALVFIDADYSLQRFNPSRQILETLAASTSFDLSMSGIQLLVTGQNLYYTKGTDFWRTDLNGANKTSVNLGEIPGTLAWKNQTLYYNAPLIKKSTDGGQTWYPLQLKDAGELKTCGTQLLVIGSASYSYLDQNGNWLNINWNMSPKADFKSASLACSNDTLNILLGATLYGFKIGQTLPFKQSTLTQLKFPTISSISSSQGKLLLANDTATWTMNFADWTNPLRISSLPLATAAEPIYDTVGIGLHSNGQLWWWNQAWQKQSLNPDINSTHWIQGKLLSSNSFGNLTQFDPNTQTWINIGTLPSKQLDWISVGSFLISQNSLGTSASYSTDLGKNWNTLTLGNLDSTWFATQDLLCMVQDHNIDSITCSDNWQNKKEIPNVLSAGNPTFSGLNRQIIFSDGYGTWISKDSARTWNSYGSIMMPQLSHVAYFGSGRALAMAASPGWRNTTSIWERARIVLMGTMDDGQTWSELLGSTKDIWNFSPAALGNQVILPSVSGDIYGWNLATGAQIELTTTNSSSSSSSSSSTLNSSSSVLSNSSSTLSSSSDVVGIQNILYTNIKSIAPNQWQISSQQETEYTIYAMDGKQIQQLYLTPGTSILNLSTYPRGMYWLRSAKQSWGLFIK